MAAPHKYPIGRADFESIIKEGFVYVDKTERIYEMISDKKFVFLSRPRRFGKSLLVNTLCAYFEGKKELFKGLKIYDLEKDWIKYPVIQLDMSSYKDMSPENIETAIAEDLSKMEIKFGIVPNNKLSNGTRFKKIIETAKSLTGNNTVVLIDEYDAPLNAHLYDDKLKEVKSTLQEIFQQIQVCEKDERFVFITGIAKYLVLDNLEDISINDVFSDICGFTKDELVAMGCDEDSNCYIFSKMLLPVFNPAEVFEEETFNTIPDYIRFDKEDYLIFNQLGEGHFFKEDFYCNVGNGRDFLPLLYQHGFLTIKDYDCKREVFSLCFPRHFNKRMINKLVALPYCKYYKGEEDNPFESKSSNGKFWFGEQMFVTTGQNLKYFAESAQKIKAELSGKTLDIANTYSIEQLGIIIYIEELFRKWCPYDENFDWIFEY